MINRNIAPPVSAINRPSLWQYQKKQLANGIEIVYLHDPAQEVFKIDVSFAAGAYYQPRPVTASTMLNMLNEGTRRHSAEEIAETFDYHGAYVDYNCGMHKSEISLISLTKYASPTIRMLAELVRESVFPEKELETYLRNRKQQLLVDLGKTAYLARMEFSRRIYGEEHPYANHFTLADFDRVTPALLESFYRERVQAEGCRIVACGNVSEAVLRELDQCFSDMPRSPFPPEKRFETHPSSPGRYRVEKPDAVQTSIRIGKRGVRLTHGDYTAFQLLNMVLGGYFGSRLMSNIREEKGLTYGIASYNVTLPLAAHWMIAADVNAEQAEAAIDECLKEIRRLREEPVPEEELELVKSNFNGEILRELDGVFAQSDALKHKLNYGLDNSFYLDIIDRIKGCTPDDLQAMAGKHLDPSEMIIVTAGKS